MSRTEHQKNGAPSVGGDAACARRIEDDAQDPRSQTLQVASGDRPATNKGGWCDPKNPNVMEKNSVDIFGVMLFQHPKSLILIYEAKNHGIFFVEIRQVEMLHSWKIQVWYPPSNKHGSGAWPLGRRNSSMNRLYSTSMIVSGNGIC